MLRASGHALVSYKIAATRALKKRNKTITVPAWLILDLIDRAQRNEGTIFDGSVS